MTRTSLRHAMNHRDFLDLFINCHWRCSLKKSVLKNFANFTGKHLLESLFDNVAGLKACNFIKKRLQHWYFPIKFPKFLRTSILKNICERLLLLVSPQNTIANSSGKFELDETSTKWKVSIFLNVTTLFNQMQPYTLYVSEN